ncbi:hypothetical protein L557_1539 [Bordetella pertussis STO1-CNMC-0004]|nr:hypothetical protein L557_1539 [Bordetella pertussis STO1-CNMC-0004]
MHGSSEPDLRNWKSPRARARCTHLQTQPGRIQPIDSSHLGRRKAGARPRAASPCATCLPATSSGRAC